MKRRTFPPCTVLLYIRKGLTHHVWNSEFYTLSGSGITQWFWFQQNLFNSKMLKPSTYPGVPLHHRDFSRVATTGKYAEELGSCNLSRMQNLHGMSRQLSLYTHCSRTPKSTESCPTLENIIHHMIKLQGEKETPYDQFKVQKSIWSSSIPTHNLKKQTSVKWE